jgi:hypothetical protein
MTEKKLRTELTRIAKENIVTFETFEQRMSDSLDFIDVSVWGLEAAMKKAYELGLSEGMKEGGEK